MKRLVGLFSVFVLMPLAVIFVHPHTLAQDPDILVDSIAWSPTGSKVAAGYSDGYIDIIDGSTGQTSLTLQGHSSAVVSIAWSPDESQIISGSLTPDNTARIWDAINGQEIYQFGNFGPDILAVGWSPDGTTVIAVPAEEGGGQIWNPATGQLVSTFQVGTSTNIAWSPDGTKIAFGLSRGAVDIRSSSTLEELVLADITNRPQVAAIKF